MSKSSDRTFGQAVRTLAILEEQNASAQDLATIHEGYLVDLLRATKQGCLPPRHRFRRLLGLSWVKPKVWKTVTLGLQQSGTEYLHELLQAGYHLDNPTKDVIQVIPVSARKQRLNIVLVSLADLGFDRLADAREIFPMAAQRDLGRCPAEVGLALRLLYKGQPFDEWFDLAMEPLTWEAEPHGGVNGRVFKLSTSHDGKRWLTADPCSLWGPDHLLAFVLLSNP